MIRGAGWRRARQFTQAAAFALYLVLAAVTYRGAESLLPFDLFFRLDPLAGFAAMLAARTIVAALLLSVVMLAAGIVLGRVWCGWLCPLGALLDWVTPRRPGRIEPHPAWRKAKYVLLVVILVAALLGNLSLLVLDPLTLLNRALASAVFPALNVLVGGAESILYPLSPLQPAIDALESVARGAWLPSTQTYYGLGGLMFFVLLAVVAMNWLAARAWCRYLCPLGAVYALEARFAWFKPHAVSDCNHCAACMKVCPTAAITVTKEGLKVDPAECTLCMDCVAGCPENVIAFKPGASSAVRLTSDLSRRQVVTSAAFGLAAVALLRTEPAARRADPFQVLPPGALDSDFYAKCIRCGECVRVCPTGVLQPAQTVAGLGGLWAPALTPRLGYCDYACNACGQVCPTGAIPKLTLEEKRTRVIGLAYIDTNRCIPFASYRPCIVCEEMCPLPDKAIKLEPVDVISPEGIPVHLQRPQVLHDRCIGCGICEYQCPLNGPAAIRVYVPNLFPPLA